MCVNVCKCVCSSGVYYVQGSSAGLGSFPVSGWSLMAPSGFHFLCIITRMYSSQAVGIKIRHALLLPPSFRGPNTNRFLSVLPQPQNKSRNSPLWQRRLTVTLPQKNIPTNLNSLHLILNLFLVKTLSTSVSLTHKGALCIHLSIWLEIEVHRNEVRLYFCLRLKVLKLWKVLNSCPHWLITLESFR